MGIGIDDRIGKAENRIDKNPHFRIYICYDEKVKNQDMGEDYAIDQNHRALQAIQNFESRR